MANRLNALALHLQVSSRPEVVWPTTTTSAAAAPLPVVASVLTAEDLATWERDGVVIVKKAVPDAVTAGIQRDMRTLCEIGPAGSTQGWYNRPPGATRSGAHGAEPAGSDILAMYQTQSQWDARSSPRVYAAFVEIWGTPRLWSSIAPCNLKEPIDSEHPGWGGALRLHWDRPRELWTDPGPMRAGVQAVLHLADTTEQGGGFRAIPGFHRLFEEPGFAARLTDWQPGDTGDAEYLDLPQARAAGLRAVTYGAKQGDLLIWNSLLPHGNSQNRSATCRMAQ